MSVNGTAGCSILADECTIASLLLHYTYLTSQGLFKVVM
jgi:hypothetical protein